MASKVVALIGLTIVVIAGLMIVMIPEIREPIVNMFQ